MELHQGDREDRLEVRLHAIDVDTEGLERALAFECTKHARREEGLERRRRLTIRHDRVVVIDECLALALAERREQKASNTLHSGLHVLLCDLRLGAEFLNLLRTNSGHELISVVRLIRNERLAAANTLGRAEIQLCAPCFNSRTDLLHSTGVLRGERLLGLKALFDRAEEFLNLVCHCLISVLLRSEDLTVFGSLMQASTIPLMVSMLRQCNQKRFNAVSVSTS